MAGSSVTPMSAVSVETINARVLLFPTVTGAAIFSHINTLSAGHVNVPELGKILTAPQAPD